MKDSLFKKEYFSVESEAISLRQIKIVESSEDRFPIY